MLSILGLGGHSNSAAEYENGCSCLIMKGNPGCDCVVERGCLFVPTAWIA